MLAELIPELLEKIIDFLPLKDKNNLAKTCKYIYDLIYPIMPENPLQEEIKIGKHKALMNKILIDLFEKFHHKEWNFSTLTSFFPFEIINKYLFLKWDWEKFIARYDMRTLFKYHQGLSPLEILNKADKFYVPSLTYINPDDYDYPELVKIACKTKEQYIPDYDYIRRDVFKIGSTDLPLHMIIDNPDYEWDWLDVIKRQDFTITEKLPKKVWDILSENTSIDIIITKVNLPWNWTIISAKDISLDFLLLNSKIPWDWNILSKSKKLTYEYILTNRSLPWNWTEISAQDFITMENYQTIPFTYEGLSSNLNFSLEFIFSNLDLGWSWDRLSQRTDLTGKFLAQYQDYPWNWYHISSNYKDLTYDKDTKKRKYDYFTFFDNLYC